MAATYPPLSVPASPEYFLALFRLDEDQRELTLDMPAAYLANGCWDGHSFSVRGVVRSFLAFTFPGCFTATDFDREFPTLRRRTVGDVCRFLADRVPRPAARPWLNDRAAGAFLTIRHQLAEAGADVSDVRPSALLEPYLRSHPKAFECDLPRMAPGLPFIHSHRPVERAGRIGMFGGLVLTLALGGLAKLMDDRLGLAAVGLLCCGIPLAAAVTVFGALLPPRRVTLGDLVTFRDLARAVAVQQPA